ncbi:sodium:solute symporter family protein [Microtetraspora fusca]|uniref:sodium:solute symporter family protein n=1 Tax=Microtetraspora fusca TaxID=1997 RepID=UPI00082E13BA|nr:sodium:solute symporter family protein [Microtetraspora fusca]
MLVGYGAIALLLLLIVLVLERSKRANDDFSDYTVAGRSFGSWYQTMSFLNTWLPGSIFISFTGLAAGAGVIGFYYLPYSLLAMVLMFFMAQRVHDWGRRFDLRTQADFLGRRFGSRHVRTVAAVIGVVASFPWLVLGLQSLGLVFSYLSFGRVSANAAILIGIGFLALRQIWTVRMGMRGVVVSDMVQGLVAYVLGLCVILGLLVWLLTNGHTLDKVPGTFFSLPGPGSEAGPLYLMSIVLTGALGGWCWPDIFVRLFTARSTAVIKRSAVQIAPFVLVFATALSLLGMLASTVPGVSAEPDHVWFITAGVGGTVLVSLAGVIVLAATMGNVDANMQACGALITNDVLPRRADDRPDDGRETATAKVAVIVLTVLAAAAAAATTTSEGLYSLAIISYQGICQLAPALFLGIFWRRGTAAGAIAAMLSGFAVAAVLQAVYETSIPWLGGLTSGVAGLIVNTAVYVGVAFLGPRSRAEEARIASLFDDVSDATHGEPVPAQ